MKIPPAASKFSVNPRAGNIHRIFCYWNMSALRRNNIAWGKVKRRLPVVCCHWLNISSLPDNATPALRYWIIIDAGDNKYFRAAFHKQGCALKLQAWGLQRYRIALETCIQVGIVLANVSLIILVFSSCNFVLLAGLERQHSRTKRRQVWGTKHFTTPYSFLLHEN